MRSQETVIVLQVLKQLHMELSELRAEVQSVKDCIERIEQTGLVQYDVDDDSEEEEFSYDESSEDASVASAPF